MSSSRSMPSSCPRGVMVSSTVIPCSSKRLRKIDWCFGGMNFPPSSTRVRSSSIESCPSPSVRGLMNMSLSRPCTNRFTNHTTGYAILSSGVRTYDDGSAMYSG